MTVKRIVANIATDDIGRAKAFYEEVLGLRLVMDLGFIATFAADGKMTPQIGIATEGGSGTPVPDLSIEVDDVDEVHRRAVEKGLTIEYGPVNEPWNVRRFYTRDPFGRLVNVLMHL
jgi:catechol 2,3-dioxygenase-like lactoylglutathione lyase family enzyme